jgi:hypothetical protein
MRYLENISVVGVVSGPHLGMFLKRQQARREISNDVVLESKNGAAMKFHAALIVIVAIVERGVQFCDP